MVKFPLIIKPGTREAISISLIQHFEAIVSKPQNREFRINPENISTMNKIFPVRVILVEKMPFVCQG